MLDDLTLIAQATGARGVERGERIQSLWSGYGEIYRVQLAGAPAATAVVKSVQPPARTRDASHARKCRSYDVELAWYRNYRCDHDCRVPDLLGGFREGERWLLVLEDLDAAGFTGRRRRGGRDPLEAAARGGALDRCLRWLAAFHARFLGVAPVGLWVTGTYWHLGTRLEELRAIGDRAVRERAPELDRALLGCRFQTLVHGDAKLANFCFSDRGVAAVDFQYVGGGPGIRDVAYLIAGEADEERLLDRYFEHLRASLSQHAQAEAIETEWRALYPIATADFERFLAGWGKA